tara:strand:+ start:1154 stop:2623 length:1470 start_codon:yes stop_codon:yes gene_type:complete
MDQNINNFVEEDFLNFELFKNILFRKKKLIAILTSVAFVSSIIYASFQKHIWQGTFDIYIVKKQAGGNLNLLGNISPESLGLKSDLSSDLKTQLAILRSPSVLMPVYIYSKELSKNTNSSFNDWRKANFEINQERGTKISTVIYRNKNKSTILPVLNKIAEVYRNYSKKNQEKSINQGIDYLEKQVENMKTKTDLSLNKLQSFAIKYGLSNIDGINTADDQIERNEFKKRYSFHERKLNELESELIEASSFFKPESKKVKILNQRIKTLKESITRPNEIILKYRDLGQDASRNEETYSILKRELIALKLQKAKNNNPWELISSPTLSDTPVAPNKKFIVFRYTFLGFLISFLIAYLKYRSTGLVYEIGTMKKLISYPLLFIIDKKSKEKSESSVFKLSDIFLNFDNIKSLKIVTHGEIQEVDKKFIIKFFKKSIPNYKISISDKLSPLDKYEKQVLIFTEGVKEDLFKEYDNKYNMNIDSIIGWIFIKN